MRFGSMKKVFICAIASLGASVLSAASVSWTAGGFAPDGAISGTAYLIQAPSNADVTSIASYLEKNGTNYTGDAYSLVGEYTLSSATNFSNVEITYDGTPISGTSYFTLILVGEDSFILSDLRTGEVISGPNGTSLTITFPAAYPPWIEGVEWTYGELAGDDTPVDPGVPEPTALALLTLGVAGVALRRRIR